MIKKLLTILLVIFSTLFTYATAEDFEPCTNMVTGVEYTVPKSPSGDKNYFKFTVPEDGIYILSDSGACSGYFYIHDENKETLARAGYSADTLSLEIIRKMSKGDVYYFSAESKYGGYTLTISPFDTESVNWMNENEEYNTEPLEQIGPCTPEVRYFCPTEDGYYNFSASGTGDSCGGAGPCNMNALYYYRSATSMHSEYFSSNYYLLKKDMVYPILATCGSSGMYNTSMRYIVYRESMDLRGNYKIGGSLKLNTYASHTYYSFVPEKTSRIIIRNKGDISDWFFNLYDTITGEAVPAFYQNEAIECQVIANRQYYLVLESGEYDLYSCYIEESDNTPVTTSDTNLLQSPHYYGYNMDKTWTYHAPDGTKYMDITFSENCELLDDTLYIYDKSGALFSSYKGTELAGKTLHLKADSFKIRLVTNSNYIGYGFKVDNITCYDSVTAPECSLASGTVRPSQAELTAHPLATIYYSINSGEYKEYTSPIDITRDSTLTAYAQIDDAKSETVTFNYKIDSSLLKPPVINVVLENDLCSLISFSAEEGTVYYKRLLRDTEYRKYTSGNINLDYTDRIVAYTASGKQKSEYVYYERKFESEYRPEIPVPVITCQDIEGGKRITIRTESKLGSFNTTTNYCADHYEYQCGKNGYVHDNTDWSMEDIYSYVDISYGGYDTNGVTLNCEQNTYTFDVFDNTYISACTVNQITSMTGMWHDYMYEGSDRVHHLTQHPEFDTTFYDSSEEYSDRVYLFVEVPKATAPSISVSDGKATLTAGSGSDIYYSINGGEYIKYTTSVPLSSGDRITAYAAGTGCSKSDVITAFSVTAELPPKIENEKVEFSGKITNNLNAKSAIFTAALYDLSTGRLLDIHQETVTAQKGYTYVDGISLDAQNSKKTQLKLFLWDSVSGLSPLAETAQYTLE